MNIYNWIATTPQHTPSTPTDGAPCMCGMSGCPSTEDHRSGKDRRRILKQPPNVQFAAGITQASQEGRAVWMIDGKCPWSWCA